MGRFVTLQGSGVFAAPPPPLRKRKLSTPLAAIFSGIPTPYDSSADEVDDNEALAVARAHTAEQNARRLAIDKGTLEANLAGLQAINASLVVTIEDERVRHAGRSSPFSC
jgi:hypothetical protein